MQADRAIALAREFFPDLDRTQLYLLLWERTGFPCWWEIPDEGYTPEECLRTQLARVREEMAA